MGIDLYQQITDRIIAELEKGCVPWHKPWRNTSGAGSRATGKPYSVLNQLLLPQPGEYVTYRQAIEEGHPVKKGEKASMVYFFKFIDNVDKDTGEKKKVPLLKYYSVFHISQCDGMKPKFLYSEEFQSDLLPDYQAEKILNNYVSHSRVKFRRETSNRAYYSPLQDMIVVPDIRQFTETAEFYSTAFHEAVHSTGHPSRLNRITNTAMFGSESYSKEELIAELGASYLVNLVGIETLSSFKNSSAYINGWLSALKNNKRLLVSAAGKAEKAVNFILNNKDRSIYSSEDMDQMCN